LEISAGVRVKPVDRDRISRGPWVKMLTSHMDEVGLIIVTEPEKMKERGK
jgi:putative aminopeptidase FrvX